MLGHVALSLGNGELTEVKDTGREYNVGATLEHAIYQMIEITDTTRSDDRHCYRIADRPGHSQIEAGFSAVAIHAGHEQLAGPVVDHLLGPFNGIQLGRAPPAMGEDLPARCFAFH